MTDLEREILGHLREVTHTSGPDEREAVARAMANADSVLPDVWSILAKWKREQWLSRADAAIAALTAHRKSHPIPDSGEGETT